MSRAQSIVCRDSAILMVMHRHQDEEWWCLPGGAIEVGESPDEAALRELWEECQVRGTVLRETSILTYGPSDQHHTYWVDIGSQTPRLGRDPEVKGDQILVDMTWKRLSDLAERDRVYLWAAGLLGLPEFQEEISNWSRSPSYPEGIESCGPHNR